MVSCAPFFLKERIFCILPKERVDNKAGCTIPILLELVRHFLAQKYSGYLISSCSIILIDIQIKRIMS